MFLFQSAEAQVERKRSRKTIKEDAVYRAVIIYQAEPNPKVNLNDPTLNLNTPQKKSDYLMLNDREGYYTSYIKAAEQLGYGTEAEAMWKEIVIEYEQRQDMINEKNRLEQALSDFRKKTTGKNIKDGQQYADNLYEDLKELIPKKT